MCTCAGLRYCRGAGVGGYSGQVCGRIREGEGATGVGRMYYIYMARVGKSGQRVFILAFFLRREGGGYIMWT